MSDATPWDDLQRDFAFTDVEQAEIDRRAEQLRADQAQYLDAEPFADTDLDGPEARQTVLGADDYQRLLDHLDEADRAHGQAMRARKRGGSEV